MKQKTTQPKTLAAPYVEACPKGKYKFSKHQLATYRKRQVRPGIVKEWRRCKLCGGVCTSEMDYTALAGVFSIPAGRAK